MKSNFEYIDDYFAGFLTVSENEQFNARIVNDNEFAKEVALYLQAQKLSSVVKKKEFHELNESLKRKQKLSILKGVTPWLTAASILIIGVWTFLFNDSVTPQAYAQNYITTKLISIDTPMAGDSDSLSNAVELFNQKKYNKALNQLNGSSSPLGLEYKGLCYLQLGQYQQSVDSFKQLAENKEIIQNKGLFYQAIVLIKMNKVNEAKLILDEIKMRPTFFGQREAEELSKLIE